MSYQSSSPVQSIESNLWFEKLSFVSSSYSLDSRFQKFAHRYRISQLIQSDADLTGSLFVILEGWVSLSKSLPNGQTQIIDFGLPGDLFDLTSADGVTAVIGLEAITDTTIAVLPREYWSALHQTSAEFAKILEFEAAAIRSRIAERMLRLGRGSAEERLAYAFLELGIRSGAMVGNKPRCFSLPLTQQQIGDFMGLTSVHVCRTMRRLVRDELITSEGHININVINVPAIENLAGITVDTLEQEIMFHT